MEGGQRHQACDGEQKAKSHPDQDHNQTRPNQPAKEGRGIEAGKRTSTAHTRFRIRLSKWSESLLRRGQKGNMCTPTHLGGREGRGSEGGERKEA